MKDVREYLHLYLGCKAMYGNQKIVICGININSVHIQNIISEETFLIKDVKPILSRLSDMTEEDAKELCMLQTLEERWINIEVLQIDSAGIHFLDGSKWVGDGAEELNDLYVFYHEMNAMQFAYLLSKGYWIFDQSAFDKGLIIDRKTLQV